MGQVGQWQENAHMRVYRAGSYIKNPVGRYVWQKEPCCQRRKGPGCGQTACLDDAANDVIYRRV